MDGFFGCQLVLLALLWGIFGVILCRCFSSFGGSSALLKRYQGTLGVGDTQHVQGKEIKLEAGEVKGPGEESGVVICLERFGCLGVFLECFLWCFFEFFDVFGPCVG